MSVRKTITIPTTLAQDALLRDGLKARRLGRVNEVIRAALRFLERDEAAPAPLGVLKMARDD